MSEFKYACPVCGQHIKCDTAQAGTVMDCPTCFQKITVPQAPSGDGQKFIITGSKVMERLISARGIEGPAVESPAARFPLALALILSLLFVGVSVAMVVWLVKSAGHSSQPTNPAANVTAPQNPTAPQPKPAPKPVLPPPANDTNWMLELGANDLPDTPAAGRIHGQDFITGRTTCLNSILTLRAGTHGPADFGIAINFGGASLEELSGKTITVTTNAEKAAKVTLRWKDEDGTAQRKSFDGGYALRLEFGALENNRLPGKIYLCTPDPEKSYLVGSFNADTRKPKPKTPKQ